MIDNAEQWEEYDARLFEEAPRTETLVENPEFESEIPLGLVPASPSPFLLSRAAETEAETSDHRSPGHPELDSASLESFAEEAEAPANVQNEAPSNVFDLALEESEFRVDRLPLKAQTQFSKTNSAAWRDALTEAINAGIRNPKDLADLIFFMQHRDRVVSGVGKLIAEGEHDFVRLRAEWDLYCTIAARILAPSTKPSVFLPAHSSPNYEDFVAAPTTGRITLMVNGRNSDGTGHTDPVTGQFDGFRNELKNFDRMEETVESLGAGDSLFIVNWQFVPTGLLLTADPSGSKTRTWGDLLAAKAKDGVKIRVIISQHPVGSPFMTDLDSLNAIITPLPADMRDNFKYIVSSHPHTFGVHHQKFMVARKGKSAVAYCGGLDISFNRAPQGHPTPRWGLGFVWHDIGAKLEGMIAHDLEREFVERWNREKAQSAAKPLEGWKPLETLSQAEATAADKAAELNKQALQMIRTVSVGPDNLDIRRDDIWRGYFRLIGRATRFIYLENQYFNEPKLADAIVKQAESQPELIVIVMVGTGTDDRQTVDPKAAGVELAKQRAMVDATQNAFALRHEFFKRLSVPPLTPDRLRIYTLNYPNGILHSKLLLVDDEALTVGSANGNLRGFFFDTELNVMLDDAETVKNFRQQLWAHNLGVAPGKVATWGIAQFVDRWDAVAKFNQSLQATPSKMVGEGVIPFKPLDPTDPRFRAGKRGPIHLPLGLTIDPSGNVFELGSGAEMTQASEIPQDAREAVGQFENKEGSEAPEVSAHESPASSEHVDLSGESAPWLQRDPIGNVHAESEWRDVPRPKKVDDSFAVPFRWICKISILKNGKYDGGGSGVLISDRHVLTAAHVINDVLRDPVQYDLEVTMAMDGNKNLGSAVRSGRPYVPALYDPSEIGSDYDYALITLSHPLGQSNPSELKGDKLCFWGSPDCGAGTVLVRVDPKSLITQVAYSAGFPKNKGIGAMWCFSGILAVVDEKRRTMVYTAEITEGQSGSPVWIRHDGKSVLVGIAVSRSTDARRFVVRITRELCRQLTAWIGLQHHETLGEQEEAFLEAEGDHSFAESVFEVVPSELADLEEHQVAPQGLVLIDHMHTPKTPDATRPGTFTTGTLAKLTTLNPLFIDAADNVVTDTTPTGLQTCLNKLITSKYDGLLGARGQAAPGPHDHVHVAIVDLTGNKLTAPDFAGWGATTDIGGASVPKILGLYGAFQLRSDLRELATRTSPADGKQLESSAVAEWRAKGLASQLPDLTWLFDIQKWTPTATIDFTAAARTSIRHIVDTCHAGTLISKVSLPYIASLTWQSGLFHPTRSGLWLKSAYCNKGDWNSPVSVPNVHNATALSAATYFTLLAQGRLVDQASSTEIATALGHGCVTSLFPRLPVVASKCGILHGLIHDCAWIQSRSVRYVIAVLSKLETTTQKRLYPQLCADLDVLIQKNNQTPKSPCVP